MGMSMMIVFFVCLTWFLNSQCLEKYYLIQKKNLLVHYTQTIDEIYNGDPMEIDLQLEKVESATGGNIFIVDQNSNIIYHTRLRKYFDNNLMTGKIFPEIFQTNPNLEQKIKQDKNEALNRFRTQLELKLKRDLTDASKTLQKLRGVYPEVVQLLEGEYKFIFNENPRLKTFNLNLVYMLNNKHLLVFSSPVEPISESAKIASKFSLFVGILCIILGSIFASFFSKRFTKPIRELHDIAQRMTKLDFNKKCEIECEDEVGELSRSINILSDQLDASITELNEANQKLQKDIEHERKIDKMRKEFISSVSHELKTPIALIQGYAEGLKDNVVDDEENKKFYSEVIVDEAEKMGSLVKDLLNLSQIDSGQFKLEKTVFDISSLIDHVLDKYRAIVNEKDIQLLVEKNNNLMVNADQIRIEQILSNFINNAIDHIDSRKQIKIRVTPNENKMRVSVYNSGKPIPEASLDEIWTSFYKIDKARTRAFGGSGLGLSIVRAIQEQHNNAYGVENLKDGVEFWFECDAAE